ncbi:MAG: hypothetical protein AAFQ43_00220 [Bacteroidota bacterium]
MLTYPYMLLSECAGPLAWWIVFWSLTIVVEYGAFAWASVSAATWPDSSRAVVWLQRLVPSWLARPSVFRTNISLVFFFCALCGYGVVVLGMWWGPRYIVSAVALPLLSTWSAGIVAAQLAYRPLDRISEMGLKIERLERLVDRLQTDA